MPEQCREFSKVIISIIHVYIANIIVITNNKGPASINNFVGKDNFAQE